MVGVVYCDGVIGSCVFVCVVGFSWLILLFFCCCFFFFKQKTAYEIGTGDWSSDVCSSDLFAVFVVMLLL